MMIRDRNPYVGLRPFEQEDAYCFFGRDGQVEPMLKLLEHECFLAVVGVSGSGKSSLVKAGLVPALYAGSIRTGRRDWVVVDMKPREGPIRNLAVGLAGTPFLENVPEEVVSRADYAEAAIRHSSSGLADLVARSPASGEFALLVVVDQFEEVFRFARLAPDGEADEFVQLLLATALSQTPVFVVLTMRSDFLGDCARFRGLPEQLTRSQFLIPRLERDDIRAAIEGPAELAGTPIDPALVTRLLNDLGEEPNRLPLLQHALRRIWARNATNSEPATMTLRDYEIEVGTLGDPSAPKESPERYGALDRHAEEILAHLEPPEREAKRWHIFKGFGRSARQEARIPELKTKVRLLFQALTEVDSGNLPIRRPCRTKELALLLWPELDLDEGLHKLGELTCRFRAEDAGFLTPAAPPDELPASATLDISHEALITHWRSLERWVGEEQANSRQLTTLASDLERGAEYNDSMLKRAEQWWKACQPTEQWAQRYIPGKWNEIVRYLSDQRAGEEKRREERARQAKADLRNKKARRNLQILIVAVSIVGAVVSYRSLKKAEDSETALHHAISDSFLHRIELASPLREKDEDALWELIAIPSESSLFRKLLIEKWINHDDEIFLTSQGYAAIRSAAGLDQLSQAILSHEGRNSVNRELRVSTSNPHDAHLVESILKFLDKVGSPKIAKRLIDIFLETDIYEYSMLFELGEAIISLPDVAKDREVATKLVDALLENNETSILRLRTLAEIIASLPDSAKDEEIAHRLLEALLEDSEADGRHEALARVIISLPGSVKDQKFAAKLLAGLGSCERSAQDKFLGIAEAIKSLPLETKGGDFSAGLLSELLDKAETDHVRLSALAAAINSLPDSTRDIEFASMLMDALIDSDEYNENRLSALARVFVHLPGSVKGASVSNRLVGAFFDDEKLSSYHLNAFASAVMSLPDEVKDEEFSIRLLEALQNVSESNLLRRMRFSDVIISLPSEVKNEGFVKMLIGVLLERKDVDFQELRSVVGEIERISENRNAKESTAIILEAILASPDELRNLHDPLTQMAEANVMSFYDKEFLGLFTALEEAILSLENPTSAGQRPLNGELGFPPGNEISNEATSRSASRDRQEALVAIRHLLEEMTFSAENVSQSFSFRFLYGLAELEPKFARRFSGFEFEPVISRVASRLPNDIPCLRLFAIDQSFRLVLQDDRKLYPLLLDLDSDFDSAGEDSDGLRILRDRLFDLEINELVGILRWPICYGQCRRLVLEAIEAQGAAQIHGASFNGSLWTFLESAPSFGIDFLGSLPDRPTLDAAISGWKEWKGLKHDEQPEFE
jgi:energy-coupling factor transporter ATP-binding protein EcfA2